MSKIKRIIVHCSASVFGDYDFIKKIHVKENKWRDIGYHYIIYNCFQKYGMYNDKKDGLVVQGRSLDNDTELTSREKGAHAYGFNSESIGVCLIGNKSFTEKQFKSLYYIWKFWKTMIPGLELKGHYHFTDKKTCPNFDVDEYRKKYRIIE